MILQSLNSYYERMLNEPDSGMPEYGISLEKISFALVLDEKGSLVDIEDLREQKGKKPHPRLMLVPAALKRSGTSPMPNFLWDNTAYVLGLTEKENQDRAEMCQIAFTENIKEFGDINDSGIKAVITFLEEKRKDEILTREDWEVISGTNLVFRLSGVPGFIHERPAAKNSWKKRLSVQPADIKGQCLISGEPDQPLARLHPNVKGTGSNWRTTGNSLVAFNQDSFLSYGKEQSYNAPVSQYAAFSYATALTNLLGNDSRRKITIGDTTYVFWAKRQTPAEDFLANLFDPPAEEVDAAEQDDQATAGNIHGFLKAIRDGRKPADFSTDLDDEVQFYILGLAPNAARLSIRFWQVTSLGDLLEKVGRHYQQLNIVRQFDSEPELPPLRQLLLHTANLKGIKPTDSWDSKNKRISPALVGSLTRAMLTGTPYPQNLLSVVLDRIRAEHNVTYFRAALLKAYLLRNKKMEVPVSFDPDRTDQPYLLGRLFAVLEKAQEEAVPGTNATIKDRYLASAAATPAQVFHLLLKNSANHISKLRKDAEKRGRAIYLDTMIQDINAEFNDYPKTQKAEEQGLFMIGYYHQRKNFFTKKTQEG